MTQPAYPRSLVRPISRHALRHQRATRVRPAEGMRKDSIEIVDEIHQFLRKSFTEVNEPRRTTFLMITPKTTSIWFSRVESLRSQRLCGL